MYLFFEQENVSNFHRLNTSHHDNAIIKTKNDYYEMIFDWESARYTKPDKPLNAYDTLYKFYPHLESEILPLLKELNLDKSTTLLDKETKEYADKVLNITVDEIKKDMINSLNLSFNAN